MENFTNGAGRKAGHGKQRHANMTGSAVLCLVLCVTVLAAGLVIFGGSASATGRPGQPTDVQGVPAAQGTPPGAVSSSVAQPIETGGVVGPVASVGPSNGGGGGQANQGGAAGTQQGGGFPLWVLVPILLALIAVAVFILVRRRPAVEVAAAGVPPSQRPYAGTTRTTTTTTSTTAPVSAAAVAGTTGVAGVAGATGQVACPNCGATNEANENFCHDCGQDLRPVRAQMSATPLPVDVVDEYTPYLETLNRADEQLEYVLSRARITIGSAAGNDIVVDAGFNGSGTVSGVHAELRRDAEGFVIADRGSETGVYVNGEKVTEATLKDNDQVRVGDVQFVYHAPARP